jgi:prevent-host-death family protein
MTQTVSVDEAQNKLPDLLADALAGNEVIITEHGHASGAPGSGCGAL